MNGEQKKLLDFLQTSYNEYQKNILPLMPDNVDAADFDNYDIDEGYRTFDEVKNEFLESLWDVISQHFADATKADDLLSDTTWPKPMQEHEKDFDDGVVAESPITEDQCPNCGSTDLHYGDKNWQGDQFGQETVCNACEFAFQQWYQIIFDGMTKFDEDGCSHIDIK